jgi:hypothetical protein
MALHSNDLEEFLDAIADKYWINADATTERIYGKTDINNTDYMKLLDKKILINTINTSKDEI